MGVAAAQGILNTLAPATGEQAQNVLTGKTLAVGPSQPQALFGVSNLAVWASFNTTLTTTANSLAATVGSGGALAPGCAVNSVNVPPGTTWATFSGTSGTLALPTISLQGNLGANGVITGLAQTAGLLGAAVSGPGIPAGAVVGAILTPAIPTTSYSNAGPTYGSVQLSNPATTVQANNAQQTFNFALTASAITAGADIAAIFTGAAIVYSATVQLERSFDGGATWTVCNIGSSGTLAQWAAGTPVNLSFTEPERGVSYRVNVTAYSSGTINYRLSQTAGAAMSISTGGNY